MSKLEKIIANIFEEHISNLSYQSNQIQSYFRSAKKLQLSILEKAFQGRLVPQDPNDEPAEILLERIKNR